MASCAYAAAEIDFANDQVTNIGGIVINQPLGTDQILLRLTHSTPRRTPRLVRALGRWRCGRSASLAQIGRIFGTGDTPGDISDESWTRARIVAYAPAITEFDARRRLRDPQHRSGRCLDLQPRQQPQRCAELGRGPAVFDSFTVQVADEHGAIDTETITITVTGSNDAPNMSPGRYHAPWPRTALQP